MDKAELDKKARMMSVAQQLLSGSVERQGKIVLKLKITQWRKNMWDWHASQFDLAASNAAAERDAHIEKVRAMQGKTKGLLGCLAARTWAETVESQSRLSHEIEYSAYEVSILRWKLAMTEDRAIETEEKLELNVGELEQMKQSEEEVRSLWEDEVRLKTALEEEKAEIERDLEDVRATLEDEIEKNRETVAKLEDEIEELRGETSSLREEMSSLREEMSALVEERDEYKKVADMFEELNKVEDEEDEEAKRLAAEAAALQAKMDAERAALEAEEAAKVRKTSGG